MQGKKILLGVTGGIAAYKAAELVRRLVERGAEVQVVMTHGASEFITATTFQALSGKPVRASLWDPAAEAAMGHIELARWADLVLVAPASADFLARLATGRADDLLATLCLATSAPILVAPAMNRLMWANAATQANVATLTARGVILLGPGVGDQACGEVGPGRMLEPHDILAQVAERCAPGPDDGVTLVGTRVLITAGPTREYLDPVRFISNCSSGKMGYAIAQAFAARGAEVVLVSGPVSLPVPAGVRRIGVESAQQMAEAVDQEVGAAAIFVGTAAVADFRPESCSDQKMKKRGAQSLSLPLVATRDILASVAARPQPPFVVGFAAETEKVEEHALEKLKRKNLDIIAANEVGYCKVFDCEDNALLVLTREGGRIALPQAPKSQLAAQLVALIAHGFRKTRGG